MKSWWNKRIIPTLPTLRVITRFLWGGFLVIAILVGFKYIFFTNCLSVGSVKACITSAINSSDTFFAIGGILVAIVALIPTFWIEGKIKDAKKEVSQKIFEDVRENMQRLSKAQMLIFDADRYQSHASLLVRDGFVQEAIHLWPAFKTEEYGKLSKAFSSAITEEFYQGAGIGIDMHAQIQGLSIPKKLMGSYIERAIFYSEGAVSSDENLDRDDLVNLACMYGCCARYEDMIRAIERAIKFDENAKDDFQETKRLALLMYACQSDRRRIEKLGRKIGKDLPLSKAEFVRIISKVDLQSLTGYIRFFALKKRSNIMEEAVYLLTMTPQDVQGQRRVSGLYLTMGGKDRHDIPLKTGDQTSMEEFFEEVDKELYVICSYEG